MPYKKGKKVETGIWHLEDKKGVYLAEVNYVDPHSGNRVRRREVAVLRNWRTSTKTDAIRREISRERGSNKNLPFKKFADEYLKNWAKVHKRPSSYTRDEYSTNHLKTFFGSKGLGRNRRKDVESYIAKRKGDEVKPGTVNRELSCLKNMLRKAVEWEYIADNPAWGVSQQREQLPEFTFLLEEESDRFVDQAPAHLRTLFIVALNTGLRRGELFKLEWRDLDFNTGQGIVSVKAAKNYETRYVPMNEKTRRSLLDHPKRLVDGKVCPLVFNTPKGEPLHDIRTGMGYALERAQIGRHIRFHDLRHTFASDLVMEGVDIRTVAKLLGHKDIRITMRYAHLAPDHLQAAVNVLDERKRKVKKEESENLVSQ